MAKVLRALGDKYKLPRKQRPNASDKNRKHKSGPQVLSSLKNAMVGVMDSETTNTANSDPGISTKPTGRGAICTRNGKIVGRNDPQSPLCMFFDALSMSTCTLT